MANKKSVFLANKTIEWIESTTTRFDKGGAAKWSESVNATFEQLIFLLEDSLPNLSSDEWLLIFSLYADYTFPAHGVPAKIASDVMARALARAKDVDPGQLKGKDLELVNKVHGYSQIEKMAILYVIQLLQPLPRADVEGIFKDKLPITISRCVDLHTAALKSL